MVVAETKLSDYADYICLHKYTYGCPNSDKCYLVNHTKHGIYF